MILMSYWKYYGWRWLLLLFFLIWGYSTSGPIGTLWALLLFGVVLFIGYTVLDAWHAIQRAFNKPTQVTNFNLTVERDVIKGTPAHPDPTRPSAEDYLPLIESFKHRKEIQ